MINKIYTLSLLLFFGGCSLLFAIKTRSECNEKDNPNICEGNVSIVCRQEQLFRIHCDASGFTCNPAEGLCNSCGDGVINATDECDDGNEQDNDCCSNDCHRLTGNCELEPNDTNESADDFFSIASDASRTAFLGADGDSDIFAFSLANDASVSALLVNPASLAGCEFGIDPKDTDKITLSLTTSSGALIAQSNDVLPLCPALLGEQLVAGDYLLQVSAPPFHLKPPTRPEVFYSLTINACGDGSVQPGVLVAPGDKGLAGEQCDDGNQTSGDGCRADCLGFELCGDTIIDLPIGEDCDDGGAASGDGCDQSCLLEPGFINEVEPNNILSQANALGSVGVIGFGDQSSFIPDLFQFQLNGTASVRATLSATAGEACPESFQPPLTLSNAQGVAFFQEFAGVAVGQVCETIDPEKRAAVRALPAGDYVMNVNFSGAYSLRVEIFPCGDGLIQPGQECDPSGGACDAQCQRVPTCGDGFVDAPEICDDNNQTSGDGCDQNCQREVLPEIEPNDDGAVQVGGFAPPGNDFSEANAQVLLEEDTTILGAISPAGDEDVFQIVDPGPGRSVRIDIFDASLGVGQPCGPGLDTFLNIVSPGGGTGPAGNDNRSPGDFCSGVTIPSFVPGGAFFAHILAPLDNQALPPYLLVVDYIECGDGVLDFGEECEPVGLGCDANCRLTITQEAEPNEDGSVASSGDPLNGNDFSSQNAGTPFSADVLIQPSINPAGDEDVFAIQNPTAAPLPVRVDTFDIHTGTSAACEFPNTDTVLSIRDAAGVLLAQNNDRNNVEPCSGLDFTLAPNQTAFVHVSAFGDNQVIFGYLLLINFP